MHFQINKCKIVIGKRALPPFNPRTPKYYFKSEYYNCVFTNIAFI